VGATDSDHRNALGREVAASASSERLDRDPVALTLDEDDGLHRDLLNAVPGMTSRCVQGNTPFETIQA